MYRLLDYSETKRYLKIENTFSTKKYPIYYSHDPQTLETYVTKVIASKDAVINCYKAHINHNIFPYLQLKKQHANASILSVLPEEGEVIIKINQEEKNKKCNYIKAKIDELTELLAYYKKYHQNHQFQGQLSSIQQFLDRFKPGNPQLVKVIEQVTTLLSSFPQILSHVNQLSTDNDDILQRLNNLREVQIQNDEHMELLVNFVVELGKKGEKIEEQTLKRNQISQLKDQLQRGCRVLSKISSTLKEIEYLDKEQDMNQVELIYKNLLTQENELKNQEKRTYESNVLYVTKKFIKGITLRQMIINKDQRLTPQFCFQLTKTIVDFIFVCGGVKDLFITTQNIIVEDCGTFHLNYFSFIGLEFVKLQKYVSKADFLEILPYINYDYLYGNRDNQIKMGIQVYLRFIIVNFVSAFLKKDIIFDSKSIDFEFEVQINNLRDEMRMIEDRFLCRILPENELQKIQKQFDLVYKVGYGDLAKVIFGNNKIRLTWQFIFSRLSKSENGSSKLYHKSVQKFTEKINIIDLAEKCHHATKINYDAFYIIDVSFMEAVDHFINILCLFTKEQNSSLFSKLTGKNQALITKSANKYANERTYFQRKGWYCKEIYIPVKTSMTFTQILDHSNWVQMLANENRINLQTLKGVQNLLSFLLQMQATLILLEPLLNDNLLQASLLNEKCTYYTAFENKGNIKTYYTLLHNYKDKQKRFKNQRQTNSRRDGFNSDEDSDHFSSDREQQNNGLLDSDEESSDELNEQYNFKKYFWKSYFATLKIIYIFIKNYYIRINEVKINGGITINGGRYTEWLSEFIPTTPPLTAQQ